MQGWLYHKCMMTQVWWSKYTQVKLGDNGFSGKLAGQRPTCWPVIPSLTAQHQSVESWIFHSPSLGIRYSICRARDARLELALPEFNTPFTEMRMESEGVLFHPSATLRFYIYHMLLFGCNICLLVEPKSTSAWRHHPKVFHNMW